jgi:YebC/PmpR family DNA-binding regulatory protein
MPKDNIERAIKKGAGDLDGGTFDEVIYEGYGPGGVAIFCEVLTDNRNRTGPELRNLLERHGGKLGATGCVAWMFDRKGLVVLPADAIDEEALFELALEAGADDVRTESDRYDIICEVDAFHDVSAAIEAAQLATDVCKITRIPQDTIDLDAEAAKKVLKLMEALDDHDDVQNVSSNFNVPDEVMAEMGE